MDLRPISVFILLSTVILACVHALPLDDEKRAAVELPDYEDQDKHNDVDQYGDYDSGDKYPTPTFKDISKEMGCKVLVTTTYNRTIETYDFETGTRSKSFIEENVTAEECCDGWQGDNCDIQRPIDSPCGNITCQYHPGAQCALIKRCGVDIPLFVDDMGRVIRECLSEEHLCMGICKTDPCKGLTCERHPDAMCFTSGCSCEPVWLLPTKVRVSDCSLEERKVRQADDQCLPS